MGESYWQRYVYAACRNVLHVSCRCVCSELSSSDTSSCVQIHQLVQLYPRIYIFLHARRFASSCLQIHQLVQLYPRIYIFLHARIFAFTLFFIRSAAYLHFLHAHSFVLKVRSYLHFFYTRSFVFTLFFMRLASCLHFFHARSFIFTLFFSYAQLRIYIFFHARAQVAGDARTTG
jgi:hypothetical protein